MPVEQAKLDLESKALGERDASPNDSHKRLAESAEKKFLRLRDQWKAECAHESSTQRMVMHSAYQRIVGMGKDALPFLLRELATNVDAWFWALRAITEADPVPEEARGNGTAMAQAWLQWARDQGIAW